MSGTTNRITVLRVGLFPDRETLERALAQLQGDHDIVRHELNDQVMDDTAWDRVVDDILSSAKVITV